MIRLIVFDLGGVIFRLDKQQAIARFKEIGVDNIERYLDDYEQKGFFGELESGKITAEEFRRQLSREAGRELTMDECGRGWTGYAAERYQRNFDALLRLKAEGYALALLSNTNPFMMRWVRSNEFDGHGHSLDYYIPHQYLSYEMGLMKPDPLIFTRMLDAEHARARETLFLDDSARNCAAAASVGIHTYQPENGGDWTSVIHSLLSQF